MRLVLRSITFLLRNSVPHWVGGALGRRLFFS